MTFEKLRLPASASGAARKGEPHPATARADEAPAMAAQDALRAFADTLPMRLAEVDAEDLTLIWSSRALGEDVGITTISRCAGRLWTELFHPDDREALSNSFGNGNDEGWRGLGRLLRSDGTARWMAIEAAVRDRTWLLTLVDIHDFKRASDDELAARAQAEGCDRFLLDLEDELRVLGAGIDVRRVAARRLAEFLHVDRCAYAIMETDEDHCEVDQDYARPGVGSAVGRYVLSAFGSAVIDALRSGHSFVIDDAPSDARLSPYTRTVYAEFGVAALICVPLQRAGHLVAAMAVHQAAPRRWRQDEIALVHAVSHRCWESIERARAEADRRAGDARFRALVEGAAQIVWSADAHGGMVEPLSSWCMFTGQDAGQAIGDGWLDAVHLDDRERVRSMWRQALDSSHAFEASFASSMRTAAGAGCVRAGMRSSATTARCASGSA
jgi:PAS domain S-box-containing protein